MMSNLPNQCQNCHKAHDFQKECFGHCNACNKGYMCEQCCSSHECIPEKRKDVVIITNPSWKMNLVKRSNDMDKS